MGGLQTICRKGGDRHGRGEEQIPIRHEAVHLFDVGELPSPHREVGLGRVSAAGLDAGDKTGVHFRFPFLQVDGQR